ncbi:MAG: Chaperone protein DnaJ [Chroococcopsis gigantea SAG 12.99]|jgi:molecular chaperone DnaJ|nr:DnaJ domain-containing protein [Chlorogloea purpurea SAG 13.99]MDV3001286.1 Chaperone protein DnaJ [Chroococcopsis gigantea SAG 12.99]
MTDHYQTLQVAQQATSDEIKQAYRRLAKQFHPDSQGDRSSHEKIVQLNAAYEILGDPHNRRLYDRQLKDNGAERRQQRSASAQDSYNRYRQAQKDQEAYFHEWHKTAYLPLKRLIRNIIKPLKTQINELAADPFDDLLMAEFQSYLQQCSENHRLAQNIFTGSRSPGTGAKVAANLYYCLNHISDGLEELQQFTLNYDDRSLHTGLEMFRLAWQIYAETEKEMNIKKAFF